MLNIPISSINRIPNNGSDSFTINGPNGLINLMIIKKKSKIFIYLNSCPHIGAPLDFSPGNFLDQSKEYILCSSHGALFRIDDGYCISGPCAGKNLKPIQFVVKGNQLQLIYKTYP